MSKIKPINCWTKQTMIEQIEKFVPQYGCYSVNDEMCRYRLGSTKEEGCCPVGAFIPEDKYSIGMEYTSVYSIYPNVAECMPLSADGMHKMQMVHDLACSNNTLAKLAVIGWINENVED